MTTDDLDANRNSRLTLAERDSLENAPRLARRGGLCAICGAAYQTGALIMHSGERTVHAACGQARAT